MAACQHQNSKLHQNKNHPTAMGCDGLALPSAADITSDVFLAPCCFQSDLNAIWERSSGVKHARAKLQVRILRKKVLF